MIDKIVKYMTSKGQIFSTEPNEYNIVYVEGINPDFTLNDDKLNQWNDLRLVFSGSQPTINFIQVATTEPGKKATNKPSNKKGVARIAFGQYTAWKMGYHKIKQNGKTHPALVQVNPVKVCRDFNKDGKRTNDLIDYGLFGINQHSTKPGYNGDTVENWSEGCLVGRNWNLHLQFLDLLKQDTRYIKDNNFIFTTTIIAGDDLLKG